MKPRSILMLSLGLNVALSAALFAVTRRPPAPTNARTHNISGVDAGATSTAVANAETGRFTGHPGFHWRSLESADYRQYVANLRGIGCPETTLRDIIVSDLDQLYAARDNSGPIDHPPWHNFARRQSEERVRAQKQAALRAEKRALVKELIGYEWDHEANEVWHQDLTASLLLGFLPDSKAPQLMTLVRHYTREAEAVREAANHILIDEDRVRLRKLYDDLAAEVFRLLTPFEREELELRVQIAMFLPAHNISFDLVAISGAQLREFARLSKTFKDMYASEVFGIKPYPQEEEESRRGAFDRGLTQLLGPELCFDYFRAQDPRFRDAFAFVQERKFPAATALELFAARQAAEFSIDRIKGANLGADEQPAIAAVKSSTTRKISSLLGDSFDEYLAGPGYWLERIAPVAASSGESERP